MLPKLQQSSIANSLRRDNLASQIQCTPCVTQARTSSRISSAGRTTNLTNPGKTNTPPKTRTPPSATSQKSTSPKTNSNKPPTSPSTNLPYPAPYQNMPRRAVLAAALPAPLRRSLSFRSQCPNRAPSKNGRSRLRSSGGTTIEGTCR